MLQAIILVVIVVLLFEACEVDKSITRLIVLSLLGTFTVPPVGAALWVYTGLRCLAR